MSRIGKLPIIIPSGVTVEKRDGNLIVVKGPKGELDFRCHKYVTVEIADGKVTVTRIGNEKDHKSMHGLSRTLIANMVHGVTKGFSKQLEILGVGYRAMLQGSKLVLSVGYSHPVEVQPPKGIQITIDPEKKNILTISGADKQVVGEIAAKIREFRKPEPYKGKGIRYMGEYVPRKAGKAAIKEK
jgi:large subunit ribosomal protein L6